MNEWMDDEGDHRTAPATPGLLNICIVQIGYDAVLFCFIGMRHYQRTALHCSTLKCTHKILHIALHILRN